MDKHDGKVPSLIAPKKRTSGRKSGTPCSTHGDFIIGLQGHQGRSPVASPSDDDLAAIAAGEAGTTSSQGHTSSSRINSSADELSSNRSIEEPSRSPSLDSRRKKKVNICTAGSDDPLVVRTGTSSSCSLRSDPEQGRSSSTHEPCLTLSGTIQRGRKAGQSVDVRLNMSREELEEAAILSEEKRQGFSLPTLILSCVCAPFVFVAATVYNFYMATITWYNVFTHFANSKRILLRALVPPVLLLCYPFLVVPLAFILGINAAVSQIGWDFTRWKYDIQDLEKGFFGWACSWCRLEECSPYEVVIIMDVRETATPVVCEQATC